MQQNIQLKLRVGIIGRSKKPIGKMKQTPPNVAHIVVMHIVVDATMEHLKQIVIIYAQGNVQVGPHMPTIGTVVVGDSLSATVHTITKLVPLVMTNVPVRALLKSKDGWLLPLLSQ